MVEEQVVVFIPFSVAHLLKGPQKQLFFKAGMIKMTQNK